MGVLGAGARVAIGIQPPNERSAVILLGMLALLVVGWFGSERRRFAGPPAVPGARGPIIARDPAD